MEISKTMEKVCGYLPLLILLQRIIFITGENGLGQGDPWVVHTSTGPVEGAIITAWKENQAYVFYGIPYAEPPVGELRFKPPQPVKPWTDVLITTKKPLPCYQQLSRAHMFRIKYEETRVKRPWSEDCLTLNIWVPKPRVENAPVLAVFHPGVFEFGSNNFPDGVALSVLSHDIVVSMNYRLGTFGFLNLGVPEAPGNMGLLDQQLALKWIQENIHYFGGLTKAVILIGAGDAGAASVGYHVLAPGSKDYFASIVPFSGSPTCSWAFQNQNVSLHNSKVLSERLQCAEGPVEEKLACLRNAHPEDIIDASSSYATDVPLHFMPTVDGTFISETPLEVLNNGHFKKTVSLSVSNVDEGSLMLSSLNADLMPKPEEGMGLDEFRKAVLRIYPGLTKTGLDLVENFYLDKCDDNNAQEIRDAAVKVYSDVLINCCMNQFNNLLVQKGGVVFQCAENARKESLPSWVGSSHGISMLYSFGYTYIDEGYSKVEIEVMDYYKDWVKEHSRKKAGELKRDLVQFEAKGKNYSFWGVDGFKYLSDYRGDHCRLWNEIIPTLKQSNQCEHA